MGLGMLNPGCTCCEDSSFPPCQACNTSQLFSDFGASNPAWTEVQCTGDSAAPGSIFSVTGGRLVSTELGGSAYWEIPRNAAYKCISIECDYDVVDPGASIVASRWSTFGVWLGGSKWFFIRRVPGTEFGARDIGYDGCPPVDGSLQLGGSGGSNLPTATGHIILTARKISNEWHHEFCVISGAGIYASGFQFGLLATPLATLEGDPIRAGLRFTATSPTGTNNVYFDNVTIKANT